MQELTTYFELGWKHIADVQAYDHMLFLGALWLSIPYGKHVQALWAVTAFTLGHSLALALAVIDAVRVNRALIEFLIPVTILITLVTGWFRKSVKPGATYALTVVFGLIHGMGFSGYLKMLLGGESSVLMPLLGFNLGVEAGQVIILVVFSLFIGLMVQVVQIQKLTLRAFLSGVIGTLAVQLVLETKIW